MKTFYQLSFLQMLFLLLTNIANGYNFAYSTNSVKEEYIEHLRFSLFKEPLVLSLGSGKSISLEPITYCRASSHRRRHPGGLQTCSYYIETLYIDNFEKGKPKPIIKEVSFTEIISQKIIRYISNSLKIPIEQFNSENGLKCNKGICSMKSTYQEIVTPDCCSFLTGDFRKELLEMEKFKDPNGLSNFFNQITTNNLKIELMRSFEYKLFKNDYMESKLLLKIKNTSNSETSYHFVEYLKQFTGNNYYNLLKSRIGTLSNHQFIVFKADNNESFAIEKAVIDNEGKPGFNLPMYNASNFIDKIGYFNIY